MYGSEFCNFSYWWIFHSDDGSLFFHDDRS